MGFLYLIILFFTSAVRFLSDSPIGGIGGIQIWFFCWWQRWCSYPILLLMAEVARWGSYLILLFLHTFHYEISKFAITMFDREQGNDPRPRDCTVE